MKNYYQMLGISVHAESVDIQRALVKAAEQQKISLEDLAEIKATLLNPEQKVKYDIAHKQHFPAQHEPVIIEDEPQSHNIAQGVVDLAARTAKTAAHSGAQFLESRREYKNRVARVNKSIYILTAFLFGVTGIHHMLVGQPSRALLHFLVSCTIIGMLFTIISAYICMFKASKLVPDEHGFITVL